MARAMILLLDSFGIGGASDADNFGDKGSDTFGHILEFYQEQGKDFVLPNMFSYGLLKAAEASRGKSFSNVRDYPLKGCYGYASPKSHGKDTLSGHWEIAGVPVFFDWGYFPYKDKCFPKELIDELVVRCNLPGVLGEKHASGTEIIKKLGEEHCRTGKPIIYTSADSVFQIAAHEDSFGLDRLYEVCAVAFELVQKYKVARVIARPFVGDKENDFTRTANRRDYAVAAPDKTLLDIAYDAGRTVIAVGKISDIFAGRGISISKKGVDLKDLMDKTLEGIKELPEGGFLFTNFVDFDSKYGHRRDVIGYGEALEYLDSRLPEVEAILKPDDLVIVTADHGCDPTWSGSNHTRENIPILCFGKNIVAKYFGKKDTFSDIGQTIATCLELRSLNFGNKFL